MAVENFLHVNLECSLDSNHNEPIISFAEYLLPIYYFVFTYTITGCIEDLKFNLCLALIDIPYVMSL